MKLAVYGKPMREPKIKPVSATQIAALQFLAKNPNSTLQQIKDGAPYASVLNAERAVNGLIKRSLVSWTTSKSNILVYSATKDALKMLSSSNG